MQGYDAYIYGATVSSYNPDLDTQEAELSADASAQPDATANPEVTASPESTEGTVSEEEGANAEENSVTDASAETAPESQENAPNTFIQNLSCYVAVDETHTLAFHIYLQGEDDSFYLADDEIVDFVLSYTNAFTLVPSKG